MHKIVKKYVIIVFLTLTSITSGFTSMAFIPEEQISLGGITPASTMEYVRSIYGDPSKVTDNLPSKMPIYHYYYGKSVEIISNGGTYAHVVSVTANNGWATPAGVTVGMDISIPQNLYGPADKIWEYKGKTIYEYNARLHRMQFLSFGVKKNKIVSISSGIDW